jgi:hypothetical protein
MFIGDYDNKKYKSPEEREKERQLKKHKETCAKNKKKRNKSKK